MTEFGEKLNNALKEFEEQEIIKRKAWCVEHGKSCNSCETTCLSRTECSAKWNEGGEVNA